MYQRLTILLLFMSFATHVLAQSPLDRQITISFDGNSIPQCLNDLSSWGDISFSYNPDLIPKRSVSATYTNTPVSYILQDMLGSSFQYKVRGSYIILQYQKPDENQEDIEFSGEIVDAKTGQKLTGTSIYDVSSLTATLSDNSGAYFLKTFGDPSQLALAVSKENYRDTIIQITNKKAPLKIELTPLGKVPQALKASPVDSVKLVRFLVPDKGRQHMKNISLQEKRPFQISFLPVLGTNGLLAGNITNDFSLNVIAGYNGGVDGFELGGMVNIIRRDMNGVQIGGFANIVGGKTNGMQLAGFSNVNLEEVNGLQFAGFSNTSKEANAQVAGFLNTGRDHDLQLSGFGNIASGESRGAQISGAFNTNTKHVDGLQLSGIFNTARDSKIQISGIFNLTRNTSFQTGGIFNFANGEVKGVQVAGIFNYAREVRGVQIGLINIANKTENGFALGLLNFIKDGFHRVEADHNDLTDINISYKSGISKFYTSVSAGIAPSKNIWSYGLGLGTEVPIKEKFYTDVEISLHNLQSTGSHIAGISNDYRLNWSVGYLLLPELSLNAGPVLHFYHFNPENPEDASFSDRFGKTSLFERSRGNGLHKIWVGYRVAFTFL